MYLLSSLDSPPFSYLDRILNEESGWLKRRAIQALQSIAVEPRVYSDVVESRIQGWIKTLKNSVHTAANDEEATLAVSRLRL